MLPLTPFECAALQDIVDDNRAKYPGLAALIAAVQVVKRENTGGGFFTDLAVVGDMPPLPTAASPLESRQYRIDGFQYPFGFLLFLRDGYPALIDCHAYGDDTSGVDFTTVTFESLPW